MSLKLEKEEYTFIELSGFFVGGILSSGSL